MTSDQERLEAYVEAWRSSVDDVLTLLRGLDDTDWARPTDLPGWDVKAVAAHLAHLETVLADEGTDPASRERATVAPSFTQEGVEARASRLPLEIVDELDDAAERRQRVLAGDPPTDGKALPPQSPGGTGWNWETLLSNRVVDVWMHEQDVRRATGRPGGMTSRGAVHTVEQLARSFGFVVGKRVAPQAGTTVVLDVSGVHPVHLAVEVTEAGRAVPLTRAVGEPTVALRMDVEAFVVLCGGRRPVDDVKVEVTGDEALGRRILEAMAVTP